MNSKKMRIREYAKAYIQGNQTDEEDIEDLVDEAIEFGFLLEKRLEKKLTKKYGDVGMTGIEEHEIRHAEKATKGRVSNRIEAESLMKMLEGKAKEAGIERRDATPATSKTVSQLAVEMGLAVEKPATPTTPAVKTEIKIGRGPGQ